MIRKRYLFIALVLLALTFICSLIGTHIDFTNPIQKKIFLNLRLSRVLLSFSCGAILALSGLSFQTLFNNPLASPYTLGIASGASLGAAITIVAGLNYEFFGFSSIFISTFAGAFLTISFIVGISKIKRTDRVFVLLLSGIAFNYFSSALVLLLQYIGGTEFSFQIARWSMGSLESVDYSPFLHILPFLALIIILVFSYYRELDVLLFGNEFAKSKGVEIKRVQNRFFILISIAVGSVVAVCGPIGFVGLMIPHMARRLFGANHLPLAFMSIFMGGFFLTLCDTIGRSAVNDIQIPVGIITSLIGGPYFLYLLFSKK